jgi:hypothetical protein
MKQLLAVIIAVVLVVILWLAGYLFYYRREVAPNVDKKFLTNRIRLANRQLEEELTFFLARQLGIYEGKFEIIDVVNLETREMAGADYLLVTLKAPDGKLCQVIVSRKSLPWAKWEIEAGTFNLLEPSAAGAASSDNLKARMKELGVTAEEVRQYYKAYPEAILKGEELFFDQETATPRLPIDWFKAVKPSMQHEKLSINKNGPARFVPGMKAEPADTLWQPDYPGDYLGAGYRSYLYEKVKDNK